MSGNAKGDLIKIKEDAIRIQEVSLLDELKSIEAEKRKSSYILLFASGFVTFIVSTPYHFSCPIQLILSILGLSSVGFALWNMKGEKSYFHEDVYSIFKTNSPTDWKERLDDRHKVLNECYENAHELLKKRVWRNNASFICIALLTLVAVVVSL